MTFDYSFYYNDLLNSIKDKMPFQPDISIILGSGLGNFASSVEKLLSINTSTLLNYPKSTVAGHNGYIHFATYSNKKMLLFEGRIHFYEGHSIDKTLLPVFITKYLSIPNLLMTNAAGGINPDFIPGDLMIIKDFNSLFIKKFYCKKFGISMPEATNKIREYPDKNLYLKLLNAGYKEKVYLKEGSYFWTSGPSYETPAEIKMMKKFGFDAVGMSTVQEILMASMLNINSIGISCITNMAAGIVNQKLNHTEVIETGKSVEEKFCRLVKRFVKDL